MRVVPCLVGQGVRISVLLSLHHLALASTIDIVSSVEGSEAASKNFVLVHVHQSGVVYSYIINPK